MNRRTKEKTRTRPRADRRVFEDKAAPRDPSNLPSDMWKPAEGSLDQNISDPSKPRVDLSKLPRAKFETLPPDIKWLLRKIAEVLEEKRPPGRPPGMTKDRLREANLLQQLMDRDPVKRGALKRAAFKVYPNLRPDNAYERARQTLKDWRRQALRSST